jgi:uncharacterized membrane protein
MAVVAVMISVVTWCRGHLLTVGGQEVMV